MIYCLLFYLISAYMMNYIRYEGSKIIYECSKLNYIIAIYSIINNISYYTMFLTHVL